MSSQLVFPTIAEAPRLDEQESVLSKIREDLTFASKSEINLFDGNTTLVYENSLQDALREAYRAGALAATATMQLTMLDQGIEVDLTRELVNAHLSTDFDILPQP